MANKTNLGKVVGDSAFEEWEKRNPGKTWDDFMESIKGPGILGFRYKETTETGSLIYDVILDGDIVSGTIEIPPGATGADFLTLEFLRFDNEGNTVVKSKNSKGEFGDEILIKRGPRGYTGGVVGLPDGEPLPPMTDKYGTIIEFHGSKIPEGWALCNGGTLQTGKYPHLIGELPSIYEPTEARYKFTDEGNVIAANANSTETNYFRIPNLNCGNSSFIAEFYSSRRPFYNKLHSGYFYSIHTAEYHGNQQEYATIPDKSSRETVGFISTLEISNPNEFMFPKAIAFDGLNFEYGGILPRTPDEKVPYNKNRHPDIYFNIEYIDLESGAWRLGAQLHNKTDFVKSATLDNMYIAEIKTTFKTKKIRLSIDPKSTPHYPNFTSTEDLYFLGRFQTYIDNIPNRDSTVLKLPDLKDSTGRYKIIYVGQPLAPATGATILTYNADSIYSGEISLTDAIDNKIPFYAEGITMTPINELRLGYANKYNKKNNTWELIKTHENQEGYYYDDLGDLKYIIKPTNYHIWDFNSNIWIEDAFLKENAKKELLNKRIELEIKKDKMIDLEIDTTFIVEEIEVIKRELEKLNG